jgi:hypothetical protein
LEFIDAPAALTDAFFTLRFALVIALVATGVLRFPASLLLLPVPLFCVPELLFLVRKDLV